MKAIKPVTVLLVSMLMLSAAACQTSAQVGFESAVKKYHTDARPRAVKEIKQLARDGNVNAQAFLGAMYASGEGVRRDLRQALYWQEKAAARGHVRAQYNLGVMYSRGMGTAQNLVAAAKWFQAAADQGLPEAKLHLGLFHEKGWVLRKCPYAASEQYYEAGTEFLELGDLQGARRAVEAIRNILPDYYLAEKLSTEIFMYE